ncbi:MAG TPA: C69 family dipeptidase, partial [Acidobacteriota bacterium]|nr:C69 family dipeptidase [Acidobacteriota bacterium]
MKRSRSLSFVILGLAVLTLSVLPASQPQAGRGNGPIEFESCTSILVGRLASVDGSTMTSHSCDSSTDRTWITIVPRAAHAPGSMEKIYFDPKRTKGPNDTERM